LFDRDDDANTPLTAEEREHLIPSYITLRHELNEAERSISALPYAGAMPADAISSIGIF